MTEGVRWWRKLHRLEPADQAVWPWQTRGLRDLLIRVADDDGRVARDFLALRRLMRAGDELDEHVTTLLDDGFLVERDGAIYVRNLPKTQADAKTSPRSPAPPREPSAAPGGRWAGTTPEQRSEAARRAALARHGRRDASTHPGDASSDADSSHEVTHGDAGLDASVDASSPRAVSGQDLPSERLENKRDQKEKTDQPRARATHGDASTHDASTHPGDASSSSPDFTDSDTETPVPLDLVERAEKHGVFSSMVQRMPGVHVEQLRDKARSFVAYWAIGGGTGQRRRRWMSKLREDLRKAHEQNKLRAIGELEHESNVRDGDGPGLSEADRRRVLERRAELDREREANERRERAAHG